MTFVHFCVCIVLVFIISLGTLGFGYLTDNGDECPVGAWLISTSGFAICLTYILVLKGII